MTQSSLMLLVIAGLSICFRDYILAAGAGSLFLLGFICGKDTLAAAGKPVFTLGIFFLMVFILLPVATGKVRFSDLVVHMKKPVFFLAIAIAAIISYFGGRGVGFVQQPHILLAIVLGTLIGVLFLKGLPAGLIIAAGIVSVVAGVF